ncbi:helix-turn-helix domain-containing protein [Streptomyces zingiberis]|uniref:helix-turn-helix domain-containing protein n=1 Tax=Streptomyces zingiberis TaxID=2053010 RepID=UPI0028929BEB|nr:helix-turn-helix transcriptional regulator [Streptomyces zingiberis]
MALRLNPTYRQRRFGEEVRRLRERAGLSSTDAAGLLGIKQPHLSNIEAGKTGLTEERLHLLADRAGVKDSPLVEALIGMGRSTGKGWWTDYRKVLGASHLDLAELEAGASGLHNYELLLVPGLLQTEAYARAVHESGYVPSEPRGRAHAVEFRINRQSVLTGGRGPEYHAIIHEAALRVLYGGEAVMRDQLLRLIEMSRLPNVTIQVFPLEAEGRVALSSHAFLWARSAVPELDTVLTDQLGGSRFIDIQEMTAEYRDSFEQLRKLALPPIDADAVPEGRREKDSLGLVQHLLYPLLQKRGRA